MKYIGNILPLVEQYAKPWEIEVFDGDRYRLTLDQPGSWSVKYNMGMDTDCFHEIDDQFALAMAHTQENSLYMFPRLTEQ